MAFLLTLNVVIAFFIAFDSQHQRATATILILDGYTILYYFFLNVNYVELCL